MSAELTLLGERIHHLRQILKISQEELAARSGLHRTYMSDLERGRRNLSFLSLLAVAQGLEVTVSDLTRDLGAAGAANPSATETGAGPGSAVTSADGRETSRFAHPWRTSENE